MIKLCLKFIAVILLLIAVFAFLSSLLLARYEHHDYLGNCESNKMNVRVELIGTFADRPNERGSPYYLRLEINGDDQHELVAAKLVSAATGQELALTKIRRGVITGHYPGVHPKVWVADDLVMPYEDYDFVGSFALPDANKNAEATTCSLVRSPKVEWRVPLKDALMSV